MKDETKLKISIVCGIILGLINLDLVRNSNTKLGFLLSCCSAMYGYYVFFMIGKAKGYLNVLQNLQDKSEDESETAS